MPKELKKNNRLSKRVAFVQKHAQLFSEINSAESWKQPKAKELITLARKELKFSKKTSACDIYASVIKTYDWMHDGGMLK